MAELGRAALVVSFVLALYAFVVGATAAITRQRRLADSARNALICCFGSTLIAAGILAKELVEHNFTFQYVQQHTSRDLSTIYSLTAFWGGEEGSLLLWLLVLSGTPTLRDPEGEHELAPGDIVCFLAGPGGAHKVTNRSDGIVRIVMLSTMPKNQISISIHLDSGKVSVWPPGGRFRLADGVGYWDGET